MGFVFFVFILNLPENSSTKAYSEMSIQWVWEQGEDAFFTLFPDSEVESEDEANQIETSGVQSLPDSDPEPSVLEESTAWPFSLDLDLSFSFFENQSPLVDPNPVPRLQALNDPLDRVSDEFEIPKELYDRTRFWFDVYTKHDSNVHVIHHTRYPWVVFKIIDTKEMVAAGKGPLWLRRDRALKFVSREKVKIIRELRRLARRKNFKRLKGLQLELYTILNQVPGGRRQVIKFASRNVRSQLGQKDFFVSGLKSSGEYLPHMERIFIEQGLPVELTRMPFVESSFNVKAESKVGASGIWQIMPRTGRAYLKVSPHIDERNSPLKATKAAARILRRYNRALKSWPLAVTGYNHGIGGVLKAKRRARSSDLSTIIRRYHRGSFRFASANFYTCFLAALYAEKYNDKIFLGTPREKALEHKVVRLTSGLRLKQVLKSTGLDKQTLLKYNLDLVHSPHRNPWLPKGYELHLPADVGDSVVNKLGKADDHPQTIKKSKKQV
ncbi:MAG: lytic transglycosylase domain-containing protein [Bdellovibrionaceae bacterium]|nr:lytic transglycosylase domain-containing protein [Pseudobdellovibrionaceae bacterium]